MVPQVLLSMKNLRSAERREKELRLAASEGGFRYASVKNRPSKNMGSNRLRPSGDQTGRSRQVGKIKNVKLIGLCRSVPCRSVQSGRSRQAGQVGRFNLCRSLQDLGEVRFGPVVARSAEKD